MNRVISYGLKARQQLTEGAEFLYNCVRSTLGPFGENWYLDKKNTITNDGVTVAREIQLSRATTMPDGNPANEINNRGAAAIREAAVKTVEEVGDGTTTAVILAYEIYKEASRYLTSDEVAIGKLSPAEVRTKIEDERIQVTKALTALATPSDTEQSLIHSATVSMGDKHFGKLIGETQFKLGKDGVIIPEESNDAHSSIELVSGIMLDNGLSSGGLINNVERQTMEVSKTKIVLTTYTIKTKEHWDKWIVPILQKVSRMGGDTVVVVARAWTEEAIQACFLSQQGAVKIYPLNAPYVNMREKMKDLSALTGATFFDSESTRLEDLVESDIGYAEKVVARRMDALITGKEDAESSIRVEKRVKELKDELAGTESDFERKNLSIRIAEFGKSKAILKIVSQSLMERQRLFDKADDAVQAVRASFQEGTVSGAGLAFKTISDTLASDSILKRPLRAINEQIMSSAPKNFKVEDWVRDPVKVLRIALENACACATSFAMAGGVVTQEVAKPLDAIFRKEVANQ